MNNNHESIVNGLRSCYPSVKQMLGAADLIETLNRAINTYATDNANLNESFDKLYKDYLNIRQENMLLKEKVGELEDIICSARVMLSR